MNCISSVNASPGAALDRMSDSAVAIAVAAKRLDAAKQQGAAMVKLIEAAARVGTQPGKGERFDATA